MFDKIIQNIGIKIKKLRLQNNYSLQALARKAGTSHTAIHLIERNKMIPSILILMKIANAFNKNITYFLEEDLLETEIKHLPIESITTYKNETNSCIISPLSGNLRDQVFKVSEIVIPPEGKSGDGPISHNGEEFVRCLEGQVKFNIKGHLYILKPGDCLHFKSDILHFWENPGKEKAKILWISSSEREFNI